MNEESRFESWRAAFNELLNGEIEAGAEHQTFADAMAARIDGGLVMLWFTGEDSEIPELSAIGGKALTAEALTSIGRNAADTIVSRVMNSAGSAVNEDPDEHLSRLSSQFDRDESRVFTGFPLMKDGVPFGAFTILSPANIHPIDVFGISAVSEIFAQWILRRKAEARLSESRHSLQLAAESDAKFRTYFDQGIIFAGLLDLDGKVVEANHLAIEGCGYTREEIIGKPFWECGWWSASPELVEMLREGHRVALSGDSFRRESHFYLADGTRRFVDLAMTAVKDEAGNIIYIAPTGSDITEAVKAREELRENRAALEFMLETAHLGDWDLDLVNDVARASFRHDQCFGYEEPVAPGEWGFERFLGHIHQEDRERVKTSFEEAVKSSHDWREECRVVWNDGSVHWLLINGSIYRTVEGKAVRMLGIVEDISSRKLAEQKLSESRERYTNIVESITDGFIALDKDWRFTFLNKQAEELLSPLNKKAQNTVGKVIWDEFPDLEESEVGENYRKAVREQKTVYFEIFYEPIGSWISVKAYPSRDGLSIYFQDISPRKSAIEKLELLTAKSEQQNRFYETILSSTPDLIYVFDLEHRFTYANKALLSMWGRNREEAIGKNCLELGYEDWHAAMHDRELNAVVATKQPIRGEVAFDGTNGRRIYDYIFVPVLCADGEVESVAGTTRDITDRKEAEEKLADNRERLQAAIDGSGAGTYRWNIQTDDVDWDRNLDAFFGFPPGETIHSLEAFINGIHPLDRAEVAERCRRCAEEGADFSMEFRVLRPDGTIRWLDDKGKTFLDENGKPHYIAGTCMDITERRLAQQWESSQKQVLELIARDAPLVDVFGAVIEFIEGQSTGKMFASVLLLDENGSQLRHGSAPNLPDAYCEAIDGLVIGESVGSCGTAAFLKEPVYVSDIATDPRWKGFSELALSHKLRACWSTPILSNANNVLGTFAMYYQSPRKPSGNELRLVDVATRLIAIAIERKRSEEKVRASAERLEFMAESMPQKIFAADIHGDVEYFNKQWMDYTGRSFEEIRDWGWLDLIHPDDREENSRLWNHSVTTGETFQFEHRIRNKDGEFRWHLSRAQAMRDDEGKIILWFGSNTDINTARMNLEEISRVSRAKDDFLAALSHELRTPLSPVLMTASALENDPTVPAELQETFAMVRRNIELEARLIDDLLDLTRITSGKLHLEPEVVDIHELLLQTSEIVRSERLNKQVNIDFALDASQHHAMADPTRLQQVFWNLVKNAVKFTPSGGQITLTTRNETENRILIIVEDTGIGMTAESLPQVFDAFDQGVASNQHQYGGLGLGLAISRAVVDAHHGEIKAASDGPDQGASFTVILETVEKPSTTKKSSPLSSPRLSQLRIMVIEDHDTTRNVLEQLLTQLGHEVTTAANKKDALAAFAPGKFDVVVSDLGLPDGSGLDLMREIQNQEKLPAIAMSGYGMEDDHRQSEAAGFSAHLVKPLKLDELQTVLERVSKR